MKRLVLLVSFAVGSSVVYAQDVPPPPAPAPTSNPTPTPLGPPPASQGPAPAPAAAPAPVMAPVPPPPPAMREPGPGTVWFGGSFEVLAGASVSADDGMGGTASLDLDTAYALNAVIEYQINDVLAIGLMPRYVFGLIASGASGDSSTALDLRGRVSAGKMIAPQLRAYGFGALGYSIIYPPSSAMSPNATGLTVTGGVGGAYLVNPRLRAFLELGYEYGFQSISENGTSMDFNVKSLEIGFGLQAALGGS